MAKIKVFMHKYPWSDDLIPLSIRADSESCIFIGECEFDYEVPADFNLVAAQVEALNNELAKASNEHMQTVQRIKGKIAELQCIENKPTATA